VRVCGTEERLVPIGQGASDRVSGEIGAKPFFLGRTRFAAAYVFAFAVEHDDVPRTELVAVVAKLRISHGSTEVIKIRGRAGGVKFMIAGRGTRTRFYAAPGLVVAFEIFLAAIGISEVPRSEDRTGSFLEQLGGGFCAGEIPAIGDVARTDEDGGFFGRRGGFLSCFTVRKEGENGDGQDQRCAFEPTIHFETS
jgi:hypothetical protein